VADKATRLNRQKKGGIVVVEGFLNPVGNILGALKVL